jgi:uncharacterized protein (TIGR02265 family)
MDDFRKPDFTLPLDLDDRLTQVPADARTKGIIFSSALKKVKAKSGASLGRGSYSTFTDYPVRELLEVLVEAVGILYPEVPPREGLRRLGQRVFTDLRESTAGTFLFSVAGRDIFGAIKLVSRAFDLFSSASGRAEAIDEHNILVELRDSWTFPEAYQVGVMEGAMQWFGAEGEVLVRPRSICDVDLKLSMGGGGAHG